MKASRDATIFIDLSFLSPEEEAVIHKVLLRDEDLKKNEIGRVRKLRESVPDPTQLKVLSGEWFEDLKSQRYGRQPHVSAVVRSSMRWKKSAAHKPNPFLKAVPEGKDEEKNKTHPDVSADPRSIHPALNLQVQQENKEEAVILEESPGVKLKSPVLDVFEAGCQSESKLQDQTPVVEPPKLEFIPESRLEPAITNEFDTNISDPRGTSVKEDLRLETSLETRSGQTDGNVSRNFKIRSFSKAQETSDWEIPQIQIDSDYDVSKNPKSKVEVVIMNSNQSTETKGTEKQNNPRTETLMNSGFEFKEEIQSPVPKRRSGNEIRVMNITTTSETTPGKMVDLNRKDDPGILENPKLGPVNDVNTLEFMEQSLDREHKHKKQPVQEIIVTNMKQRSPTNADEFIVDLDVKKDPDFPEVPANSVNTPKYGVLDQSLDPKQKEKERSGEEIVVIGFKERSPKKVEELIVDIDLTKDQDVLEEPVTNVNTQKYGNLDLSLDPVQKDKKRSVEEIVVVGFKERSPTKVEELIVDVDMKKNQDFLEEPVNNVNTPKYGNLDQNLDPMQKEKKRSGEEIVGIGFKQRSPNKVEKLTVDIDMTKDQDVLEKPVNNVNTPKYGNLDQSLDPVQKGKERVVEEIIVTDFKQRSPEKVEELRIDSKAKKDPDYFENLTHNVNMTKCVNWDQKSSDPKQKEKERVVEKIIVTDYKRRSPAKTEKLLVNLDVKRDPDFLEDPGNNENTPKYGTLDQNLDPMQKEKERSGEEIVVVGFKERSPTKVEKLIVDVDMKKNQDFLEEPFDNVNTPKYGNLDQNLDPTQKEKERSGEEIVVIGFKERSPRKVEELTVDIDRTKAQDVLEETVTNVNTQKYGNLDQSLDPVQKDKQKRSGEEIVVVGFKERSPTKVEELIVDVDMKKNQDFLEEPFDNVNTPKYGNLDQNLDPTQKEKERSGEEIVVIGLKERSPRKVEELTVDIDRTKAQDVLEETVTNVNTQKYGNLDQSLDPTQKEKERSGEEIVVIGLKKQKSPNKMEELTVDIDRTKVQDVLEEPVNSVNPPKYGNLDQSLDPMQKGKERVVEEIKVTDYKQRSPEKVEGLRIDFEKDPDYLEGPINNGDRGRFVNLDQMSSDPKQKGKERVVEEIIVADFKRRSPTRTDELNVDLNVDADFSENLDTEQVHKNFYEDEKTLTDRDKLQESVAGGQNVLDVEMRKSANTNQKDSKKIKELGGTEQEARFLDREDECVISENDILASVYARAIRPKSGVSKTTLVQEPVQKTADVIPTIVIVPSESEEMNEMKRGKNEAPGPEVLVEVVQPATDIWEDEGVDSDEDSSSLSSQDSDLSGQRGQFSGSTLSVTERTASLLSVYSDAGDFGNVAVQGSVEFAIMYSPLGELVIMVEQCQDLAIANLRKQRTDPYVKTYLYPDKRSKRKTSIKKRTVNPVYVESLRYKVKREELHGKTLNLSVWHNDSRGRNAFLGQVEINLKDWDWKQERLTWYNLQPKNVDNQESQEYQGLLCISLKYVPSEATGGSKLAMGEIHIWLREAKHLRRLKAHGVDSFVKCYMLPDTSKKSRQKTRVVKKTQDPVYNHTMVYDGFRVGEVGEACCELTVWDNNKLSNQFLGGVRLSLGTGQSYGKKVDWMDSENEEVEVWKKMMANPNSWVEGELPLRSSMTPRKDQR